MDKRKHIFLAAAVSAILSNPALAYQAEGLDASKPPSAPRAVAQAMFAAFNRNDLAALESFYADDARLTSPEFCAPRMGKEGVRRTYSALFESFPGIRDEVKEMVVEGDRVAVWFTSHSTAPGKEFTLPIMTFLTVRDGLIRTDDTIYDAGGQPCRD